MSFQYRFTLIVMAVCLLGIGSNLGDRRATLDAAVAQLQALPDVQVLAVSRWHETAPVGGPGGQGRFLNGALQVETSLPPAALLARLLDIETAAGRQRGARWQARTLDLDLLLYGEALVEPSAANDNLSLPHPRFAMRRFVLEPAAEIAASMIDPRTGWTIGRLLDHLNQAVGYVAIAGPAGSGQRELAAALAQRFGGRSIVDPGSAYEESLTPFDVLHRRAAALDSNGWPETAAARRAGAAPAVSDFWFDQFPCEVHELAPSQEAPLLAEFESARRRVVQPLLIVALDASPEVLRDRIVDTSPPAPPLTQRATQRRCVQQALRKPDRGPILHCEVTTVDGITEEVAAAIESMR